MLPALMSAAEAQNYKGMVEHTRPSPYSFDRFYQNPTDKTGTRGRRVLRALRARPARLPRPSRDKGLAARDNRPAGNDRGAQLVARIDDTIEVDNSYVINRSLNNRSCNGCLNGDKNRDPAQHPFSSVCYRPCHDGYASLPKPAGNNARQYHMLPPTPCPRYEPSSTLLKAL